MPPQLGSEQPRVLRILHVDSDALFLAGLSATAPSEWAVTSAFAAEAELPALLRRPWDACVLGTSDATPDTIVSCLLRVGHADHPVVVWMPPDLAAWIPAFECFGVRACLSRSASSGEVSAAVRDVVAGKRFIDGRLPQHSCELEPALAGLHMTGQQARVATLYAALGSRQRVAEALCVSENTVKYHLRAVYERTGASSLHELQRVLRESGWRLD